MYAGQRLLFNYGPKILEMVGDGCLNSHHLQDAASGSGIAQLFRGMPQRSKKKRPNCGGAIT